MKTDFSAVTKTKKKLKGTKYVQDHFMIFNGVNKEQRESKGIPLNIHNLKVTKICMNS